MNCADVFDMALRFVIVASVGFDFLANIHIPYRVDVEGVGW